MDKNPFISEAVKKVGGQAAAARITGAKSYQVVQQWISSGQVPARFCAKLEKASGVSRFRLRPSEASDIWPELKEASHA